MTALNDKLINELKRYQYADLAATALKSEDTLSAGISLEKLAEVMGIPKGSDGYGFVEGSTASEDGIKVAAGVYSKKFQSAFEKATVGDLWAVYQNNDFNDGEKTLYGAKIMQYSRLKVKELQAKLKENKEKLKKVMDGKEKLREAELLKLDSETKMLNDILGLIEGAKQLNYMILSEPVQKEAMKRQKKAVKSQMQKIAFPAENHSYRMAS